MPFYDRYAVDIGQFTMYITREYDTPQQVIVLEAVSGSLKYWGNEDLQDRPVIFGALEVGIIGSLDLARELSSLWDTDPKPSNPRQYVRLERSDQSKVWYGVLKASKFSYDPNDPEGIIQLSAVDFMSASQRDPLEENLTWVAPANPGGTLDLVGFTTALDFIEDLFIRIAAVTSIQTWYCSYEREFLEKYALDITQTTGGYTEQVYAFLGTMRLTALQYGHNLYFIDTATLFTQKTVFEQGNLPEIQFYIKAPVELGQGLIRFADRENSQVKRGIENGSKDYWNRWFLSGNAASYTRWIDIGQQIKRTVRFAGQVNLTADGILNTIMSMQVFLELEGPTATWRWHNGEWIDNTSVVYFVQASKVDRLLDGETIDVSWNIQAELPEEGTLRAGVRISSTIVFNLQPLSMDFTIDDVTEPPSAGIQVPYCDGIPGENKILTFDPDELAGLPDNYKPWRRTWPAGLTSLQYQALVPYFSERVEGVTDFTDTPFYPSVVIEVYGGQYGVIFAENDLLRCTTRLTGIYNGVAASTVPIATLQIGQFEGSVDGGAFATIEISTYQQGLYLADVPPYISEDINITSNQIGDFIALVNAQLRGETNIIAYSLNEFNGQGLAYRLNDAIATDQQGEFAGSVTAALAGQVQIDTYQESTFLGIAQGQIIAQTLIITEQQGEYNGTVNAVGSTYPLTWHPSLQGWGFRKLHPGATASCTIYRDSDQTTQLIGFSGDDPDIGAIQAFCAGTTGRVQELYEQGASGNNLGQFTPANMPIIYQGGAIVTDGGGNLAIYADGVNTFMQFSDSGMLTAGIKRNFYHVGQYLGGNGVIVSQGTSSSQVYNFYPDSAGGLTYILGNTSSQINWVADTGKIKQCSTVFAGPNIEDHAARENDQDLTVNATIGAGTAVNTPTSQPDLFKLNYSAAYTECYLTELIYSKGGF